MEMFQDEVLMVLNDGIIFNCLTLPHCPNSTVKYSENDEKIFTFNSQSFINLNMSKYE